jgi:hypothetical protein
MLLSILTDGMPSRRALLTTGGTVLSTALAGCSLAPSEPSTDSYPASTPNTFFSFDWNSERSTLTVRFDRGNRLTTSNTERVAIVSENDDEAETVWIGPEEANPVTAFPLTPKSTVVHELSTPAETVIYWTPTGESSLLPIDVWYPEEETGGATE